MSMHATTVRFTEDLWQLLEREAARQGVSVAQFVRDAALIQVASALAKRGEADGDATLVRLASRAVEQRESAPAAVSDPRRLRAVRRSGLLDSPPEPRFDRLTRVAASVVDAPVALLTLIDEDRQFLKSCVGLSEPWSSTRELPLSHSYCQHALGSADPVVVADAREDPRLRGNPSISDLDAIAYVGVPLYTADGHSLGALCVIDHRPRKWHPHEIALLRDIGDAVKDEIQRGRVERA